MANVNASYPLRLNALGLQKLGECRKSASNSTKNEKNLQTVSCITAYSGVKQCIFKECYQNVIRAEVQMCSYLAFW